MIPRQQFFSDPVYARPQVSNTGKRIAYIAPDKQKKILQIFIDGQKITCLSTQGLSGFFWSPDDRYIIFLKDDNRNGQRHIYRINLETKKTDALTKGKGFTVKILQISKKHPHTILIGINDRNLEYSDVYRLDLITGKKTLVYNNNTYYRFICDDDLNIRLKCKLTDGGSVEVFDTQDQYKMCIDNEETCNSNILRFGGTGSTLYLLDVSETDTAALVAYDVKSGKRKVLAHNKKVDIDPDILFIDGFPCAYSETYLRRKWHALNPVIQKDLDTLNKQLQGDWSVLSQSANLWIVKSDDPEYGITYYLYDRQEKHLQEIGRAFPDLKNLSPMKPVVIKASDGLDLVGYVSVPLQEKLPRPLVLIVHGGPLMVRDYWGYNPTHQWLTNRGYAVLSVNYRLSGGFGKRFTNLGHGEWSRKAHQDLIDAVNWAVKEGIAIKDKVAIYGESYGGYAALVGLTLTPDFFACGISLGGPSCLKTALQKLSTYWEVDDGKLFTKEMFIKSTGGDPATEKGVEELSQRSPLTYARHIKKPLLIGQGVHDPIVNENESRQIVEAVKSKSIDVTYVIFGDEGHDNLNRKNELAWNALIEQFLQENLGGSAEPIGHIIKAAKEMKIETTRLMQTDVPIRSSAPSRG